MPTPETPPRRAIVVGLLWSALGSACAAGYLIPYKAGVADVGPVGMVLPMLLAAALINTVVDGVERVRLGRVGAWRWDRATLGVVLMLGLASAVGNEAVCRALVWISPGLVSVTLRTQVIFVALLAWLVLREAVGLRFWFGIALALGGFMLLQGSLDLARALSLAGMAWALLAAAGFGAMQVVIRRSIERINVLQVNTLRLWFAAGLVALLPGRVTGLGGLDGRIWGLAATAALCGPVLSRLCLMRALRYLPAAHATLALFMAPVFAYLLAGLLLGTWPGIMEVVGSVIILVAIALPVSELTGKRGGQEREAR